MLTHYIRTYKNMYSYIHGGAEKIYLTAEDQILVTVEGMI